MNKLFGKKKKKAEKKSDDEESKKIVTKETSLVDPSYYIKKLFKKGIYLMAD